MKGALIMKCQCQFSNTNFIVIFAAEILLVLARGNHE